MGKIALIGAAGQIGTPLSLLCKTPVLAKSDLFDKIALHDTVHVPGIATDLMHIDTKTKVSGYLPDDGGLKKALTGANIVVVTAGIARKPGMTRDDLFKGACPYHSTNASIIRDVFGQSVTEEAYVYFPDVSGGEEIAAQLGVNYFAVKTELGKTGATKMLPIADLSENEKTLLDVALGDLMTSNTLEEAFEV